MTPTERERFVTLELRLKAAEKRSLAYAQALDVCVNALHMVYTIAQEEKPAAISKRALQEYQDIYEEGLK